MIQRFQDRFLLPFCAICLSLDKNAVLKLRAPNPWSRLCMLQDAQGQVPLSAGLLSDQEEELC